MDEAVIERLLALNQNFYRKFAQPFVETRARPQEGFFKLLDYLPHSSAHLLDVGCGDGRFGRFAYDQGLIGRYTGLDFNNELLDKARVMAGENEFFERDISRPDCLAGLETFELISCLAAMQHIPGRDNRLRLLCEMAGHLTPTGRIILSNWQFLGNERQQSKITDWQHIGLTSDQVEKNDYLLTWQRGGIGYRYLAFIDAEDTIEMANTAGLRCLTQFRSDGREGDLNLYTLLAV